MGKRSWESRGHHDHQRYLFSDITATVGRSEHISIIGSSGQGKSTLLRMLARLEQIDEGDILLNHRSHRMIEPQEWRKEICYVAQYAVMLEGSIEDNLRIVSQLHHIPYEQDLAHQLLKRLGLEYLNLEKSASDLSGGEKQRIALIRALMLRPSVLLLDEVTASLDQTNACWIEDMLSEWSIEQGTAMIWVTHDMAQACRISNRIWRIDKGSLYEESTEALLSVEGSGSI